MAASQTPADDVKIVFPCDNYSLRIVGRKTEDYSAWVIACVKDLAPDLQLEKVQVVDSRNGSFQSVRLAICAQSEEHLRTIHKALMASGKVQMVI
jgi:putative lipoic acid-binding regulatory protein